VDRCEIFDEPTNQPSAKNFPKRLRKELELYTDGYRNLLATSRIPTEVVDNIQRHAKDRNLLIGEPGDSPFFITDEQIGINGAYGTACALVKPGKKKAPYRIIVTHNDSPCLATEAQPVWRDPDAETGLICSSYSLLTRPHGQFEPEKWYAHEVDIVGHVLVNGKPRKVEIPGRIHDLSSHIVDEEDEPQAYAGLKVDTGFITKEQLYKAFKIKSSTDFSKAKIFIVPHQGMENVRMVGNAMGGYGQDAKVCVHSVEQAFYDVMGSKSPNTTIVLFLDNEESGSRGLSAGYRGFTEAVLRETLKITNRDDYQNIPLPFALSSGLLGELPAINADVDAALGIAEVEQYGLGKPLSFYSGAKVGWGVCMMLDNDGADGTSASPLHTGRLTNLFLEHLPGNRKSSENKFQCIGPPMSADKDLGSRTFASAFNGYMPMVTIGPSGTGLHSPGSESFQIYDCFWSKMCYQIYLQH
jgi:aspartyl aminopeptidase